MENNFSIIISTCDKFSDLWDGESQLVICLIVDLVLTERHIAHRQIVEITAVGGLKTGYGNVCLRVQLLGDAPGDAVQFHTI